ncbi:MAG: hypothetical protein OHK0029_10210 [Armatimonadaceae bacterium]
MAYADFTLESVRTQFQLALHRDALFINVQPTAVPQWLSDMLARGLSLPLVSEKARSELIVMPILLAVRELSHNQVSILSGQRLDIDPAAGLVGECDFILSRSEPLPLVQSPILSLIEAKRGEIEPGLGQCAAQMIGALRLNQREQSPFQTMYGCVTNGEIWQFLRLTDTTLTIDRDRFFLTDPERILGVFQQIISPQ